MMAKIISAVTAFFLILQSPFLFLFGSDGRALGKATLVLEASSYAVGTELIKATLHNGTLRSIVVTPERNLEKWDGSAWVKVDPSYNPSYVPAWLRPLQSMPKGFSLNNSPPLGPGRYRVWAGGANAEFTLVGEGRVSLTPEFDSYPVGTREIKALLYNGSPARFDYTVGYGIDKFAGGEWVTIGPNFGFITLMQYLYPGIGVTLECELSCDTPMEAGRYRLTVRDVYGEFTLV